MKIKEFLDKLDYERSQDDKTFDCSTCAEDIDALDKVVAQSIRDGQLRWSDWDVLTAAMFDYVMELHGLTNMVEPAIPMAEIFPETDKATDDGGYDADEEGAE